MAEVAERRVPRKAIDELVRNLVKSSNQKSSRSKSRLPASTACTIDIPYISVNITIKASYLCPFHVFRFCGTRCVLQRTCDVMAITIRTDISVRVLLVTVFEVSLARV